ncbi:MAG: signal peptidase I [Clostridia bacterium]|nr:signal peptidase I [Clostridia bacterium]
MNKDDKIREEGIEPEKSAEEMIAEELYEDGEAVIEETHEKKPTLVESLFDWVELFAFSLTFVLLILTFVGRHSPVDGTSMVPTLADKDMLLVSNLFYTPENGDIIVFQPTSAYNEPYVKRVIATGGQTVDIDFENWIVTVDGEVVEEDYINRVSMPMRDYNNDIYPLEVPEGYLFVMGDNRNGSKDSRHPEVGLVDERLVIGEVKCRILPVDSIEFFN